MIVLTEGGRAELTAGSPAYRAIGPRLSLADHGPTRGSSTAGGVGLLLREQVPSIAPFGLISYPGPTPAVARPRRVAATVRDYAGLSASRDGDTAHA